MWKAKAITSVNIKNKMGRGYYFYCLDYTKNGANEIMQMYLDQEYNVVSVEPISSTQRDRDINITIYCLGLCTMFSAYW